jgi:hypothetical protein
MNMLQIQEVVSKSDLKEFIHLPEKLHKNHKNWVPPIYKDEWDYFNPRTNRAFSYCDTTIILARKKGVVVGRIMGIINHRKNEEKKERVARFSFFECLNEREVSGQLLNHVEKWAAGKGMNKIIGPFGMCYHDPIGFMTAGFNERPSLTANYNYEYMISLLQSAGYACEADLVVYKINTSNEIPPEYTLIQHKALQNPKLRILNFTSRKELRKYIHPVLKLMNESFTEIYGYSQLDENEMLDLANHFIPLLDPKLVVVVTYDDEIAGFMITIPSINEGIIATRGHLFPLGFLKILKASKNASQLDLLIGGIKAKYRGLGIDVLIAVHIINVARKSGFKSIDSHLELESNWKMRAENEKLGGTVYKKYRIFQKSLYHRPDVTKLV